MSMKRSKDHKYLKERVTVTIKNDLQLRNRSIGLGLFIHKNMIFYVSFDDLHWKVIRTSHLKKSYQLVLMKGYNPIFKIVIE